MKKFLFVTAMMTVAIAAVVIIGLIAAYDDDANVVHDPNALMVLQLY